MGLDLFFAWKILKYINSVCSIISEKPETFGIRTSDMLVNCAFYRTLYVLARLCIACTQILKLLQNSWLILAFSFESGKHLSVLKKTIELLNIVKIIRN